MKNIISLFLIAAILFSCYGNNNPAKAVLATEIKGGSGVWDEVPL